MRAVGNRLVVVDSILRFTGGGDNEPLFGEAALFIVESTASLTVEELQNLTLLGIRTIDILNGGLLNALRVALHVYRRILHKHSEKDGRRVDALWPS